jgi:ribulose 1,5-bisphosphate synthetase/thiazole synthase
VEEDVAAMGQRIVIIGAGPTGLGAAYRLWMPARKLSTASHGCTRMCQRAGSTHIW